MKWKRGVKSRRVIDARGTTGSSGGGMPIPSGLAGLGGGAGLLVVLVVIGINLFSGGSNGGTGFDLPGAFNQALGVPGPSTRRGYPPARTRRPI